MHLHILGAWESFSLHHRCCSLCYVQMLPLLMVNIFSNWTRRKLKKTFLQSGPPRLKWAKWEKQVNCNRKFVRFHEERVMQRSSECEVTRAEQYHTHTNDADRKMQWKCRWNESQRSIRRFACQVRGSLTSHLTFSHPRKLCQHEHQCEWVYNKRHDLQRNSGSMKGGK